jgi:hypothetical protein
MASNGTRRITFPEKLSPGQKAAWLVQQDAIMAGVQRLAQERSINGRHHGNLVRAGKAEPRGRTPTYNTDTQLAELIGVGESLVRRVRRIQRCQPARLDTILSGQETMIKVYFELFPNSRRRFNQPKPRALTITDKAVRDVTATWAFVRPLMLQNGIRLQDYEHAVARLVERALYLQAEQTRKRKH